MWHTTDAPPDIAYTAEESAAMDRWLVAERGFTIAALMDTAGRRLAQACRELLADGGLARVVFLAGPGNNGGDARVARDSLQAEFDSVLWQPLAGDAPPPLDDATLLVDGLFGVGLARPLDGPARAAVEFINASPATVLAVDVPSGLSATSGAIVGDVAMRAQRTLTFVGPKTGFFRGAGPTHVGLWRAVDIGFPVSEAEAWVLARRATRGAC